MNTPRYILALDQGTTSSRAMVFDRDARVCGQSQREFAQHYPQPGWVEHDALEIWHTQLTTAREALQQAGARAADVAAIGITNQRETTVLWDRRTGQPLAPAIVWQDRRTASVCDTLTAQGHGPTVQRRTGLRLDAYFSGTKLAWLLDNTPGARAAAEAGHLAFGTIDTWLIWNLTGGALHCTDPSNASRTLLYDLHQGTWNDELLALLRVPPQVLPTIVPSSGLIAHTVPECFDAPIAIAGIAGDQQAATFGQACFSPGMVKNTYGTGCFMLMNVGTQPAPRHDQLLSTVGWVDAGSPTRGAPSVGLRLRSTQPTFSSDCPGVTHTFMLEGSVFVAGAAVQWLRDGLKMIQSADEIEALAASVTDTDDVFLVPALTGLGAPYWDPHARGVLVGMTRGTERAHVARATLESIALQSATLLACMRSDSGIALTELRADGGAARNNLLMQMQADLLGVPVVRPRTAESTALGAAGLAGLATGFWASTDDYARTWQVDRVFEPQWSADQREARLARWEQAVALAKGWAAPI